MRSRPQGQAIRTKTFTGFPSTAKKIAPHAMALHAPLRPHPRAGTSKLCPGCRPTGLGLPPRRPTLGPQKTKSKARAGAVALAPAERWASTG